ncbi:uncharacterized protein LOC111881525 [Lactuca sativa]|uniref:uncharacterized protein LOC111881525 n=1 Tax=Lactuca sativa TaxID=4236 RepID=UPI000CD9E93A|nr:uncharacterized protein LOC111881525 [Lactuca sativa]
MAPTTMIVCTTSKWLFDSMEKNMPLKKKSLKLMKPIASYKKDYDDATKVSCIMVATMAPELQRFYEDYWPYEMNNDLEEKYHIRARQEKYEVVKSFMACKMKEGESVCNHVQRMQRYMEHIIRLNVHFDEEFAIDMILNSLPSFYDHFILSYHLNNTETTLAQLHNLLQIAESETKGKNPTLLVMLLFLPLVKAKGRRERLLPKLTGRRSPILGLLEMVQRKGPTQTFEFVTPQNR